MVKNLWNLSYQGPQFSFHKVLSAKLKVWVLFSLGVCEECLSKGQSVSDFSWIWRLIQQGGSIAALPAQFASSLIRLLGINTNLLNPEEMTYMWEDLKKYAFTLALLYLHSL